MQTRCCGLQRGNYAEAQRRKFMQKWIWKIPDGAEKVSAKKVNWELFEMTQPICWTLSSLVVASYIWPGPGMKIMCFGSTSEKKDYFISSSRLGQILKDWLSRKERRVIWHFGSPAEPCIHQPVIFQFTNFWAHHVAQHKRLSPKKIHKSLSPSKMIIFLT